MKTTPHNEKNLDKQKQTHELEILRNFQSASNFQTFQRIIKLRLGLNSSKYLFEYLLRCARKLQGKLVFRM